MKLLKNLIVIILFINLFMILVSCGSTDKAPYIGDNGNWWIGDTDLGYSATGPKGDSGEKGETGAQGETGAPGTSVTVVSVDKLPSSGKVDTYKITFSDGSSTTYTVTNGNDGEAITIRTMEKLSSVGLVDTYKITFSDGSSTTYTVTNGADGVSITITSFEKVSSIGLVDTYKLIFSDGTETTYTIKNGVDGKNGSTPYIGNNGNWWIDDYDTGILADPEYEGKKATDGLQYEIRSVNGNSGMIVTGYTGTDVDVVIPDSVGLVPVIGIDREAFEDKTSINTVKLSKNIVYIEEYAFEYCSSLTSIDFNNCEITEIPRYAFRSTKISNVVLPDTVTTLNAYAFSNTPIENINYANIEYFGDYCLDSILIRYMYLRENVTYVGNKALDTSLLYFETNSLPTDWKVNTIYAVGCKISDNYMYYEKDGAAVVVQYLGDEERITIPSTIDDLRVAEIGRGFNSFTEYAIENIFEKYADATRLQLLKEVIISNSVDKIDYSFISLGSLIYIPSSVHTISVDINGYGKNFLVFEDSALPTIKNGFIETGSTVSDINNDRDVFRYVLSTSLDSIYYDIDSEMYFYKEIISYSLLAYMGLSSRDVIIPSKVNGLPITTIRSYSVSNYGDFDIALNIYIESGINKIQSYAIYGDIGNIYIPKSVKIINAYGISSGLDYYLIEATEKPEDWDTYWASNASSSKMLYNIPSNYKVAGNILYLEETESITLIKYVGALSTIKIPRQINGKNVTKICSEFLPSAGGCTVYIPKEVTIIESKAFINTSTSRFYLYAEAIEIPADWDTDWYYNSYYNSNAQYLSKTMSYTFSY